MQPIQSVRLEEFRSARRRLARVMRPAPLPRLNLEHAPNYYAFFTFSLFYGTVSAS